MSRARPGTIPIAAKHPERAAAILPRALGLLHGADIDSLVSKATLEEAVVTAIRIICKTPACVYTEPGSDDIDDGRDMPSRAYFRLGDAASGYASQTGHLSAEPDHMVNVIASYPRNIEQWRNYAMAASAGACAHLRLELLRSMLATAIVGRDTISQTVTRTYPTLFAGIQWADLSAGLTLWWWHHIEQGYTPEAARTMLGLLMDPSVSAKVSFPPFGRAPVLEQPTP